MKIRTLLSLSTFIFLCYFNGQSQDAFFTQWEAMPLYYNPALTGNFEGKLRIQSIYRNQWQSILGANSYRTTAASVDFNFKDGKNRRVSLGAFGLNDVAGSANLRVNNFKISAAVEQLLGDSKAAHHALSIGVSGGLGIRKFDVEGIQWPDSNTVYTGNDKRQFPDISAGLFWAFQGNSRFNFQIGTGLHHLNRPNIAFSDTISVTLDLRLATHATVEIPIIESLSIIPSFLFEAQGPNGQYQFGTSGRWYPWSNPSDFFQLGIKARTAQNNAGNESINPFILTFDASYKSILIGFAWDRYNNFSGPSNAYEFSVGYLLGR